MKNLLFLIALFFAFAAQSQITFSEHIAPIIYDHCTKCHRPGEIGPMAFTSYEEVAANASTIEYVTSIKYMPPWRPDPEYSHFLNENVLTDEEIEMIAEWANNGTPQGNPDLEPDVPVFPEGSQVGTPDLVLTMDEAYQHAGNNTDQYQIFVLPTGLTEDKDIEAIEVRADNREICHHAILGVDTTGYASVLDAQDPEYGYTQFGGFGFDPVDAFFSAWVPGAIPLVYPPTIGKKLYAESDLLVQMHYGPSAVAQTDQTEVNIFFSEDPIWRYVITYPISPYDLEGQLFIIPANTVVTFHGTLDVDFDVSLLNIAPHAHLLNQDWEVYAENNGDTIPLIKIPQWNFNWQGSYFYPNLKKIPAGYTIHAIASYDNTVNNPMNPNDPPEFITWGESTTDEMYLCYLQFVPYFTGDENISLATLNEEYMMSYPTNQLFPSYPNPTSDEFTIGFSLFEPTDVHITLHDGQGNKVRDLASGKHYAPGKHRLTFDVDGLAAGIYVYTIWFDGFSQSRQIIITE